MVSAWVSYKVHARVALLSLLAAWFALAACSKSECQKGECQTPAPGAGGAEPSEMTAAGNGGSLPIGPSCEVNAECREDQGEACVEGTCRLPCRSHFDCQGFGECRSGSGSDGTSGHFCDLAQPEQSGQFYTRCPSGTDADCDSANGFLCLSAGAGDLDSYCTRDCTDDSTCAAGFACSPMTRPPCADNCGLRGTPKDRHCIPSDQIGPGKAFQCGSRGVTRNVCRPRKFCSTCETDADCLATADQICAKDQSGTKICTELCDIKHPSCPWGNAAACGVWDRDLNLATCAHRFGQCTGTGKGCEPCLKDADCGARGVCTASNFTGERWCVDFSVTCACGADADANGLCAGGGCPKSPSGLAMTCFDTTPTMPDSGVCAGANTNSGLLSTSSPQTGCWPVR